MIYEIISIQLFVNFINIHTYDIRILYINIAKVKVHVDGHATQRGSESKTSYIIDYVGRMRRKPSRNNDDEEEEE